MKAGASSKDDPFMMGSNHFYNKKSSQRKTIVAVVAGVLFFSLMILPAFLGEPEAGTERTATLQHMAHPPIDVKALSQAVNPPGGYTLPARYGQVGPKLLEAGAIDTGAFQQHYQQAGRALPDKEMEILNRGSQESITINQQNEDFLFRLFWALGLSNQNPIIENGPIQAGGRSKMESLESISGWTLSRIPAKELFSSASILALSPEQQARVEDVAKAVYLPCCDHPAELPDCAHGMAMLGLLEFMASQNASTEAMFSAAKQVNAFWFPQQTLEQAIFLVATQLKDYGNVDARLIVSSPYSSANGFRQLRQWLVDHGMVEAEENPQLSCSAK